jgi:hypothetical protein
VQEHFLAESNIVLITVSATLTLNQDMSSTKSQISYIKYRSFTKLKFIKCRKIIHCLYFALVATIKNIQ